MEVTPGDLFDRLAIVQLKSERLDKELMKEELQQLQDAFEESTGQFRELSVPCEDLLELLKIVNGYIWDLEADIRKGKEKLLGLEEVGRRALMIRDLNCIRVWTKNLVTRATGLGQEDIKKDHASALAV
jgi:hypothetical protein